MVSSTQRRNAFLLLATPFFLNDIGFIALKGTYGVYLIDYVTRGIVLVGCLIWPLSRAIAREPLKSHPRVEFMTLAVLVLPVVGRLFYNFVEVPLINWFGWTGLFQFHHITDPTLYWLDLSLGLFVVALSEELIFRKFALSWLLSANKSKMQIVIISAGVFSLIHWGNGFGRLAYTFLFGLVYMAAYLKLKRLWPFVLAHWIEDFVAFQGTWNEVA